MAIHSSTAMKGRRGQFFDLRLPDQSDVYIEDVVHSLANTPRFSGHTSEFFSVAQHSAECAMLSILIDTGADGEHNPDWEDRAWACLMHDAHEAYVGDISNPMKNALGEGYRLFEFPIYNAVMEALKANEVLKKHKDHVKRVDLEMLWSDAIRWQMDGILIDAHGDVNSAPREWVPPDFDARFPSHLSMSPRYAADIFWNMFLNLGGLRRGVNHYLNCLD